MYCINYTIESTVTKEHACVEQTHSKYHANEALASCSRRVSLMVIFSRLFLDVSKLVAIFAPTNNEFTELRWQWIKMK